jgi:hypothetical protein
MQTNHFLKQKIFQYYPTIYFSETWTAFLLLLSIVKSQEEKQIQTRPILLME